MSLLNDTSVMNITENCTRVSPEAGSFLPGDISWTITCSTLVWLMVPGIGYFYSGLALRSSALSLLSLCCWSIAVVSIQWFFIGYSLAFSESGSLFIGDFAHIVLINVDTQTANFANPTVPSIVFCLYQQMLAGITPALVTGAAAERGRMLPLVVFMLLWTTFVYDFLAYWSWAKNGWLHTLGVLDFAGGSPVHIAAGAAAIVYAQMLGAREASVRKHEPHNMVMVMLGTCLIWFGWFGFNGGSVTGANARSALVIFVTNLSASVGGITWTLSDYFVTGKFSALSFCFGAVAGLVSITPASGYIAPWSAVIFGFVGAIVCHWSIHLKDVIGVDDAMDVAAVHGVCGFVGTILTGIFADKSIACLDGTKIDGGWINGNFIQVPKQLAGGLASLAWSLVITYAIVWVIQKISGLELRLNKEYAKVGVDKAELGDTAFESLIKIEAKSLLKLDTVGVPEVSEMTEIGN